MLFPNTEIYQFEKPWRSVDGSSRPGDRLHFYGAAARIVCRNAVDRTDFIFAAGNFGWRCPSYGSGALDGKPQAGAIRRDSLRSRDPDAVHQQ